MLVQCAYRVVIARAQSKIGGASLSLAVYVRTASDLVMELMDVVRRPVVHGVKLYTSGREPLVGSLCVSAYYLLYSTRRHEGQEEITVSIT